MRTTRIKHKCGHTQERRISENGWNRIISRVELTLCKDCTQAIIDLIKQGKQQEALKLKRKIEGNRGAVNLLGVVGLVYLGLILVVLLTIF